MFSLLLKELTFIFYLPSSHLIFDIKQFELKVFGNFADVILLFAFLALIFLCCNFLTLAAVIFLNFWGQIMPEQIV